eukprot:scaffold17324_cov53-Attheya_sp.AAC.3
MLYTAKNKGYTIRWRLCFLLVSILVLVSHSHGFVVGPVLIRSTAARTATNLLQLQANSGYDTRGDYSNSLKKNERELVYNEVGGDTIGRKPSLFKRLIGRPFKRARRKFFTKAAPQPGTLILVRGGESEWGHNFTFTGWADPDLSKKGVLECEHAGRLLLEAGRQPDIIYTSRLKRAINSAWIIAQEINGCYLPVFKSWRLNERHYGSLTGLCKKQIAKELGQDIVQAWRRSLKARPPPLKKTDPFYPGNDRKYADLTEEQLPLSESLADCMERTRPLWEYRIMRDLRNGNNVMVCAHANTLRGLIKIIDGIGDNEITEVSMPTGIPFVYKFDKKMNPIKPPDDSLTQVHTSGAFLEKPGLLKVALEEEARWIQFVPGVGESTDIAPVAKRMTTLEASLLKLREEREMEKEVENWEKQFKDDPITNDNHVKLMNGDNTVNLDTDEGEFEEDLEWKKKEIKTKKEINTTESSTVTKKSNIVVPHIGPQIDVKKDPVVVLIRHGRTPHNQLALFTGWEDPPLAVDGVEDAKKGGRLLREHGFEFDVVYTSWLTRAIQTAYYVMAELDCQWLPVIKSWRLNERHYGALTGKSKKMVGNIYGEDQLKKWRKGYKIRPPPVSSYSPAYPGNEYHLNNYVKDMRISLSETFFRTIQDRKFALHRKFPKSESLKDTMDRSIPFYTDKIVPEAVANGKRVLISSHENAIRGILMHLCEIPEEHMNGLHLPNGVPLIYNVKRKCISLLDDGSGIDPLEKYDFGSAAEYLFRPCELTEEDFIVEEEEQAAQADLVES